MPRLVSYTSSIHTSGVPVDTPSIGKRIINSTNLSTASLSTFKSPKPQSFSVPRIRILLAPYMSPFVVPMHKVKTWDLLHKELQGFFNLDIFNPSVRIIDRQGNSIPPSAWKDLLEPDMTVMVDTCSLLADNSPVISEAPKPPSISPLISPAYTAIESEDSYYDNDSTIIPPRGVIGKAIPMTSPNPTTATGIFNVHNWKTSMGRLKYRAQENEEKGISASRGKEEQSTVSESVERTRQEQSMGVLGDKQRSKHLKTTISRFTRAFLRILSVNTTQISSKEGNKNSEKPKRGMLEKRRRPIVTETIENNFARKQSDFRHRTPFEHQKASIFKRRGIPSLPSVVPLSDARTYRNISQIAAPPPEPTIIYREPRHSKSLSHLNIKLPSTIAFPKAAPQYTSSPAGSIKRCPRSKSFTFIPNSSKLSVISPPIPPRPSLELGMNSQYKVLGMDKVAIQEMLNDLDGATLGSRTRSRRGTVDTTSTPISLSPTLIFVDKPLPALPFKFSAFPPPSPPRSPLIMSGWQKGVLGHIAPIHLEEEHAIPVTAVAKKRTRAKLRKAASTDFGAIKRKGYFN